MPTILAHNIEEVYVALVRAFPLLSSRNDNHLAEAAHVIDGLIEKPARSRDQRQRKPTSAH